MTNLKTVVYCRCAALLTNFIHSCLRTTSLKILQNTGWTTTRTTCTNRSMNSLNTSATTRKLQALLKEAIRQQSHGLVKVGSPQYINRQEEKEMSDLIIQKFTSDLSFVQLVCNEHVKKELSFFIDEHRSFSMLQANNLPVSNKVLLHGPSGCGKTLAAYVLARGSVLRRPPCDA